MQVRWLGGILAAFALVAVLGYRILVPAAPAAATERISPGAQQVESALIGTWGPLVDPRESDELDPGNTTQYYSDGSLVQRLEGEPPRKGTWRVFTPDMEDPHLDYPVPSDAVFLRETDDDGLDFLLQFMGVPGDHMTLIYLSRGNLNVFKRLS